MCVCVCVCVYDSSFFQHKHTRAHTHTLSHTHTSQKLSFNTEESESSADEVNTEEKGRVTKSLGGDQLGILVDSEIVLSTRYGKTRVFINKTLSTETAYQQDLINRDLLSTRLIVGKVGPGMWCGKCNSTSNVLVCETQRKVYLYYDDCVSTDRAVAVRQSLRSSGHW